MGFLVSEAMDGGSFFGFWGLHESVVCYLAPMGTQIFPTAASDCV